MSAPSALGSNPTGIDERDFELPTAWAGRRASRDSVVTHHQVFVPLADGGVHVSEEATIPAELSDLPRVGTVLETGPGLVEAEWFGLGPHETYPDRKRGGLVGRYRAADLDAAEHMEALTPRAGTVVHLDAAHRGVGTASCGPDTLEPYLVRGGTYRWEWTLQPLGPRPLPRISS